MGFLDAFIIEIWRDAAKRLESIRDSHAGILLLRRKAIGQFQPR